MNEEITRVDYYPITVPDKPGEGAKITGELRKRGVNLLALYGFPTSGGKAQIDLVPEKAETLTTIAREKGWEISPKKTAFLIRGEDRIGSAAEIHERLSQAGINLVAESAVAAGGGRYGCILWVPPADVEAAAKALGAATVAAR
jgi:hypothetical protein